MATVGFIGLGTMGTPMASQLLDGEELVVFDLNPGAVNAMVARGATAATSLSDLATRVDVALLSLPGPSEVAATVSGPDGLLSVATPPSLIIDLTTNSVEVVKELHGVCAEAGVQFIDAPVSGGVAKAETGDLSVLVGGDDSAFGQAEPLLSKIGADVFHIGPISSGTIAKLVNNQIFLAGAALVQEAYVLAQKLGMEPTALDGVLSASSAATYNKMAPLLLGRRFEDVIFRLDIAAKDLAMVTEAAQSVEMDTPLTAAASELYQQSVEAGYGTEVFHATVKQLESQANITLPPLKRNRPKK